MRLTPPKALLTPCERPSEVFMVETGDIVESRARWVEAFNLCDGRIADIAEWAEEDADE